MTDLFLLKKLFEDNKNIDNAIPMKKYMKNKFEFLGIKSPKRRELQKIYLKEVGLPLKTEILLNVVSELWEMEEREYQLFAVDLLEKRLKILSSDNLDFIEKLIITKSWWDTVDLLATKIVGYILSNEKDKIIPFNQNWLNSENIWLQRTTILFQLKYGKNTDDNLLFSNIEFCMVSKEFFIQKAIGWALREYGKTFPDKVINFVEKNNNFLAQLSKREALRIILK